jgi:hypothetical protein
VTPYCLPIKRLGSKSSPSRSPRGRIFYVPQADALSQALFSIFDGLKATQMIPVNGQRVTIDASVKEATFFTITATSKEDVILVRPDGVKIDTKHKDPKVRWCVGKDYVLSTIQGPLAGEWHIATAHPRPIKVAVITDVRIEVALNQKSYVTGEAAHISAPTLAPRPSGCTGYCFP